MNVSLFRRAELRRLVRDVRRLSTIPEEILSQLDRKKPLENSVNLYQRHLFDWPSTVKEDLHPNPHFKVSQFEVDWARVMKPNKSIMYSKSSHHSDVPCIHIYPDYLKVTFNSARPSLNQIQEFQDRMNDSPANLDFINIEPIPENLVHIYVCCHSARDVRCGVIGQVLISKLRKFQNENIKVFGCSHVGGHKYAGNMIIYRPDWKQGIWYGRILPDDIENIMQKTVIGGKIIEKHWRGGLPSGEWDPKEKMTAKEAEKRSIEWQCACKDTKY